MMRNNPKQHKSREKKTEVKLRKVLRFADDDSTLAHTQGVKQRFKYIVLLVAKYRETSAKFKGPTGR